MGLKDPRPRSKEVGPIRAVAGNFAPPLRYGGSASKPAPGSFCRASEERSNEGPGISGHCLDTGEVATYSAPMPMAATHAIFERIRKILDSVQEPMTDDWDPIEVGLLLAKLEYEELDVATELQRFRELAAPLVAQLEAPDVRDTDLRTRAARLGELFANELSFAGDTTNYYNIKNSFLNDVLLRRKGIPISLSLVFMGLARLAGMKAVGISFPGHFLVRMIPPVGQPLDTHDWRKHWFVDPFDGAKILNVEDCEKRLREWTRGVVPFGPEALRVASPVEIVSRMLRNLRAIFAEKEDLPRLYWVLTALIELSPADRLEAYRERGYLYARMGRFPDACGDLSHFVANSRDGQKVSIVENFLRFLQSQKEVLN
jgi:regulator of sirC expression with transglutaminase-like and TPR domain